MPNVLVTGGAGFIGSNFVRFCADRRLFDAMVVLDALTYAGNFESIRDLAGSGALQFVTGDICDEALVEALLERHAIDQIVHFAAESHVDRSILGPDEFIRTNIIGTHTLLKAVRRRADHRAVRFHHVSTDEVFGSLGENDPPFTEQSPYAPNSPYAASKAASDHLVRAYAVTYGVAATMTNCSNNYGPFQFPEKLIPLCIVRALQGERIPVYGDGMNVRDWLYVEDHCRAIARVLATGEVHGTYNVGGNSERHNIDLVRDLCRLVDQAFRADRVLAERYPRCPAAAGASCRELIEFVTDRPGHDRRYAIDPARIHRELGFSPSVGLDEGLATTVRWYLEHEAWWRPLLPVARVAKG